MPINYIKDFHNFEVVSGFLVVKDKSFLNYDKYGYNITFTTFPDNGYLAFQSALYLMDMPDYVIYVNSSNVNYMPSISWIDSAISNITFHKADILFGGNTTFHNKTVGIGVAILKASIVREILYYTNSTFTSIPPLLSVSLLPKDKIRIIYNHFDGIKPFQNYDYITKVEQLRHQQCSKVSNATNHSFAVLIPLFKRKNIYRYISAYEEEISKANLYVLIQCENRFTLKLGLVQSKIQNRVPVYHIWCYNWSPLFMFPVYVSGMLPVDFVMRYDDDQRPFGNQTQRNLKQYLEEHDAIVGLHGFSDRRIAWNHRKGSVENCTKLDHVASPMMYTPMHAKISARIKTITFVHGEDIYLSLTNNALCNTRIEHGNLTFRMRGKDGLNNENDEKMQKIKGINQMNYVNAIYNQYRANASYVPICLRNNKTVFRHSLSAIEFNHTKLFS